MKNNISFLRHCVWITTRYWKASEAKEEKRARECNITFFSRQWFNVAWKYGRLLFTDFPRAEQYKPRCTDLFSRRTLKNARPLLFSLSLFFFVCRSFNTARKIFPFPAPSFVFPPPVPWLRSVFYFIHPTRRWTESPMEKFSLHWAETRSDSNELANWKWLTLAWNNYRLCNHDLVVIFLHETRK